MKEYVYYYIVEISLNLFEKIPEYFFQLLKLKEQIPCSVRPKAHGIHLVTSVFRIHIHVSADQNSVSVLRSDPGMKGILPEHHAADGGFFIFQGKIPVS